MKNVSERVCVGGINDLDVYDTNTYLFYSLLSLSPLQIHQQQYPTIDQR